MASSSQFANKRAVFVGCARDCATAIPRVLANISRMSELFKRSAFIFLENDSRDATKFALQRWCEGRADAHLLSLDGLAAAARLRTLCLATARNRLIATVRRDYQRFDYLFVLDCDDINTPSLDLDAVASALGFLQDGDDRAAVFANQPGIHTDLWALRHPLRCPGDVWEEVLDYAAANRVTDEEAFTQTFSRRVFALPSTDPPLEVESAFGGLGIYKMQSILGNKREYVGYKKKAVNTDVAEWLGFPPGEVGWQSCEHVSFHAGIRELGQRLFIFPSLLNDEGPMTFRPSAWRTMVFDLRLFPVESFAPKDPVNWGKVGRNEACPCGSGKRYKLCHGAPASTA